MFAGTCCSLGSCYFLSGSTASLCASISRLSKPLEARRGFWSETDAQALFGPAGKLALQLFFWSLKDSIVSSLNFFAVLSFFFHWSGEGPDRSRKETEL